jgi:hypothetical protein
MVSPNDRRLLMGKSEFFPKNALKMPFFEIPLD